MEDLEVLRQLRDPKSYLRQQVLGGVDLGLDDPELKESLSLDPSTRKPNRGTSAHSDSAAGNGHGPAANGDPPATAGQISATTNDASTSDPATPAADSTVVPPPFDPDAT